MPRLYDLYALNEKTGYKVKLNATPDTHARMMKLKWANEPTHKDVRIFVEESSVGPGVHYNTVEYGRIDSAGKWIGTLSPGAFKDIGTARAHARAAIKAGAIGEPETVAFRDAFSRNILTGNKRVIADMEKKKRAPAAKNPAKKVPSAEQLAARAKFADAARARSRINRDLETRPGYGVGKKKKPGGWVIQFTPKNDTHAPEYYAGRIPGKLKIAVNLSGAHVFRDVAAADREAAVVADQFGATLAQKYSGSKTVRV